MDLKEFTEYEHEENGKTLNLCVNAERVLLYRKMSVTSFLFFLLYLSLHPSITAITGYAHVRSHCIVLHVTYTSERATTDFTVYIATFGVLIKVNG